MRSLLRKKESTRPSNSNQDFEFKVKICVCLEEEYWMTCKCTGNL